MDTKYIYIENEGAYYRLRADSGLHSVEDVYWPTVGWVPYKGDRTKRYWYSDGGFVSEAEVFAATRAQDEAYAKRAADSIAAALRAIGGVKRAPVGIDRTKEAAGRAFQILAAPAKSKLPH